MERILMFLPSVLVIASIAAVTFIYVKLVLKKFGDNFKSIKWLQRNGRKVTWSVSTPMAYVLAPTIEELVFRAPLIIAFSEMSSLAWYGVVASSIIFAATHWSKQKKSLIIKILSERESFEHKSDDLEEEVERLYQEQETGNKILVARRAYLVPALLMGILAGYYGILYQSIWVSVGIHVVWNLVMPIAVPLVLMLLAFVFTLSTAALSSMWNWARQ